MIGSISCMQIKEGRPTQGMQIISRILNLGEMLIFFNLGTFFYTLWHVFVGHAKRWSTQEGFQQPFSV